MRARGRREARPSSHEQPTIAEVKDFWERNPVVAAAIEAQPGTPEFYARFDAIREAPDCEPFPFGDRIHGYTSSAGLRVLDVGCGNGYVLSRYAAHGAEVHGIDLTAAAVELSRRRFDLAGLAGTFQTTDGATIPYPDGHFDIVCSMGVLHHVPDPSPMVDEMYRVLQPGGRVVVMLYHRNSWNYRVLIPLKQRLMKQYRGRSRQDVLNMTDGAENPLADVYDRAEATRLLHRFAGHQFAVNQLSWRHLFLGAPLGPAARLLPSPDESFFARRYGWALYVTATKR